MQRNVVVIDRWNPSEHKYEEYFRSECRSIRYTHPRDSYHRPPTGEIRVYPMENVRDFEGDGCMIACFDILHPTVAIDSYPVFEVTGFVGRGDWGGMSVAHQVVEYDEGEDPGMRYTPKPDPDWKPQSVRVRVWPCGTMHREANWHSSEMMPRD